jgi:hypothetical protein
MLKDIDRDELDEVTGGFNACGMASLPPVNRRVGLQLAEEAYAHARSRGMSAGQFNRIGWRAYAEANCGPQGGVDRRRPFRGGRGNIVPLE